MNFISGRVTVSHLGPDHAQFKIVRLDSGKRIIVNQDTYVFPEGVRCLYALAK